MGFDFLDFGFEDFFTLERSMAMVRALIILLLGFLLARLAAAWVGRAARKRVDPQEAMVLRRLVFYPLLILVLMSALHQVGFQLGVLLGAAGVLTVALGFAAQTSASNLISGLFLIAERPFVIGDVIKIDDVTGEILSIDLLSLKLKTFDNLYVRVPNEAVIKTRVTNLTRFPLRRVDIALSVAYKDDLRRVRDILMRVAKDNAHCLEDPEPLYILKGFGDSAQEIQFSVWGRRVDFLALRNSIQEEIKRAFDTEGVEIPFPQVALHAGSETADFPFSLTERRREPPAAG